MRYESRPAASQDVERLRHEILDLLSRSERLSRDMDELILETRALEGEHQAMFESLRRAHAQRLVLERELRAFKHTIQQACRPA